MHVAVTVARPLDDRDVAVRAARQGLWIMPLSSCYLGRAARRGFVLGFAGTDMAKIPGGVRMLRAVLGDKILGKD